MNEIKKVLVIEDEEPVRRAIISALKEVQCEVIESKDGQEGLDLALTRHPDLILLDLIMPKLAGQKVCEKIREDIWGKNAHIIILTNLDSKTEKDALIKMNVDDYLVKANYKLEEIIDRVRKVLK
jgi:DNA-binding response OmpR family regulator